MYIIKLLESKRGWSSPLSKNCEHVATRFMMFSTYFLCHKNLYLSLCFIFQWHWWWWWTRWRLWCFFPRTFPISRFFLRWRRNWRTWRQGTPFARSIFDVYILLLDPYLNAHNWSLPLNEKSLIHYLYTLHICTIRTCRDAFNRNINIFGYIRSYIYTYIFVHTYTFIHILGVQLCFRRFPIDGFSGK